MVVERGEYIAVQIHERGSVDIEGPDGCCTFSSRDLGVMVAIVDQPDLLAAVLRLIGADHGK